MQWFTRLRLALGMRYSSATIEQHLSEGQTYVAQWGEAQFHISAEQVEIELPQRVPLELEEVRKMVLLTRYPDLSLDSEIPSERTGFCPPGRMELSDALAAHLRLNKE